MLPFRSLHDELTERMAAQLADPRERVRRYFQKWVIRLNGGNRKIGIGPFGFDLVLEFENRLRQLDDKTLNEMIEDAHKL